MRRCGKCNHLLPETEFRKNNWTGRVVSYCKKCEKIYYREYHNNNWQQIKQRSAKRRREMRLQAMWIVSCGNFVCRSCHCNNIKLLEIHHKDGNGKRDRKKFHSGESFYRAILRGKRKTSDLNLLCGICNTRHKFEMKCGKNITKHWKIKWK